MKKWSISAVASLILVALVANVNVANAQPAPELTNLQFLAITSDGNNYEWYYLDPNDFNIDYTARGEEVVVAIYVEGTERSGSLHLFVRGEDITNQTYEPLPPDYLSDPGGYIYGKIVYKAIPMEIIAQSPDDTFANLTVEATNYYPPNNKFFDTIAFDIDPILDGSITNGPKPANLNSLQ